MTVFAIEKGVILPRRRVKKRVYPFPDMQVGDSFAFPRDRRGSVSNSALSYSKKNLGTKFITRVTDKDQCRCWRIA